MSVLSDIHDAGQGTKLLRIVYTKKNGEISNRTVEPYEIKEDGRFYAFDVDKGGIRAFYVSNISETEVLGETYTPRWPVLV